MFLLDEPTNDLDFAGLARLERFLDELPGGVVVVSHDRTFLERIVTRVLELDEHNRRGTEFGGGWVGYLEARATARRHAEEDYATYRAQTRRARGARPHATPVGGRGRAQGEDATPASTTRHHATSGINRRSSKRRRRRATEQAIDRLDAVEKPWEGWDLRFQVAGAPRSGDVVLRLDGAVVERGDFPLGPVDLEIGWAERVAIVGPNGSGKTTLLRALLGGSPLAAGERRIGPGRDRGRDGPGAGGLRRRRALLDAFMRPTGLIAPRPARCSAKFGLGADHVRARARPSHPASAPARRRYRARYLQPYEDHVLAGGVAVLEASIEGIERTGEGETLRVTVRPSGGGDAVAFEVDEAIAATGFVAPLRDLPALGVATFGSSRLPAQTPFWESATVPGIYFAGTISQGAAGLKKHGMPANSGAVHGARYNARLLGEQIAAKHFGVAPVGRRLSQPEVLPFLIDEISRAPELWHQRAYLARVVNFDPDEGIRDAGILPLAHFLDVGGPDALAATIEANAEGAVYAVVYVRSAGRTTEHVLPPHPLHDFGTAEHGRALASLLAGLGAGSGEVRTGDVAGRR